MRSRGGGCGVQHVAATGDVALGLRSFAEFDTWRARNPLPTTDGLGRALHIIAR